MIGSKREKGMNPDENSRKGMHWSMERGKKPEFDAE